MKCASKQSPHSFPFCAPSLSPNRQVMEEISDVAVLIAHSSPASTTTISTSTSSSGGPPPVAHSRQVLAAEREVCQRLQQKQAADSLIQVIQKLSKIVEKRPQRRCTVAGQKRAPAQQGSGRAAGGGGAG